VLISPQEESVEYFGTVDHSAHCYATSTFFQVQFGKIKDGGYKTNNVLSVSKNITHMVM
jgi:hypothetical protein